MLGEHGEGGVKVGRLLEAAAAHAVEKVALGKFRVFRPLAPFRNRIGVIHQWVGDHFPECRTCMRGEIAPEFYGVLHRVAGHGQQDREARPAHRY